MALVGLCTRCLQLTDGTPSSKREHLLREHPDDAAAKGYAWDFADIPDDRVRAKAVLVGDCWFWRGATGLNGYGYFVRRSGGRQRKHYTHRYSYETFVGAIQPGHEVHHTCYNRWCFNPAHLVTMTHRQNVAHANGQD